MIVCYCSSFSERFIMIEAYSDILIDENISLAQMTKSSTKQR